MRVAARRGWSRGRSPGSQRCWNIGVRVREIGVDSPWQDLDGVAEDEDDHNREGNASQPDLIKSWLRKLRTREQIWRVKKRE